jgi:uncharacterized protein
MSSPIEYPNFKKIGIEDKPVFNKHLNGFPSYSDFNLLSLLSWNADGNNSFSVLNDNLVLKVKDYLSDGCNYSVLGNKDIDATISTLIKDVKCLKFVPDMVVDLIKDKNLYTITPDRDNFDYILSTEKVSKLEGHAYKALRKNINNFKRAYPCASTSQIDLNSKDICKTVINLTREWCKNKSFDSNKQDEEVLILNNFMEYSKHFNCVLLGLFDSSKLIAYVFNEITDDNMIMGHFGKADKDYKDSSYYMEYANTCFFLEKGYPYVNLEQDAGLEGLRTAKLIYNPVDFLKKSVLRYR